MDEGRGAIDSIVQRHSTREFTQERVKPEDDPHNTP